MFSLRKVNGLLSTGERTAEEQLVPSFDGEQRRLAASKLRRERPSHTLQPTALLNEVWLRMVGQRVNWQNRAHFLGIAAKQMDRVLKDYARRHNAAKRGGAAMRVPLDWSGAEGGFGIKPEANTTDLSVREALERLDHHSPRLGQVVKLRHFGGRTEEETAKILGLSVETIRNDWKLAKAWLKKELQ